MPYYLNPALAGLKEANSLGDGYTIDSKWYPAYPNMDGYKVAYNIYYSTNKENILNEGIKYVVINSHSAKIENLVPGQDYFFLIRPLEYNPIQFDFTSLPLAYDNLRVYPTSLLSENITATSLTIPLVSTYGFPNYGVISIGVELIYYSAVDTNNNLILNDLNQRGFNNTIALSHNIDGYDGYVYWIPTVQFYIGNESNLYDNIYVCQNRFEFPNFSYTTEDGYKQVTVDLLTTDLSSSDADNIGFPSYDYSGWHRTDPVQLIDGTCVGSYIGGEMYCADGYSGVGRVLRGFSLQTQNNQRQEILLSLTGEPVVLIKRQRTGIVCSCYQPSSEYPDDRCPFCFGGKFVINWQQYFDPRRSDGRIMVRFSPAEEDLKMYEAGLESEFQTEVWTLTVPTIKDRDIFVRFDKDGNEEFRYEILSVTRNKTMLDLQGAQKMKVQRIRHYDVAYSIPVFKDTSDMPSTINTSINSSAGIPPHMHTIVVTNLSSSSQITNMVQGHSHPVLWNGLQYLVQTVVGHSHTIIV